MSQRQKSRLGLVLALLVGAAACGADGCGCLPPAEGLALEVTDPNARSCEALFVVGDQVPAVSWGSGVKGQAVPRAPKLAVAFMASQDAPFSGEVLRLSYVGGEGAAQLESARCFDSAGTELQGDALRMAP